MHMLSLALVIIMINLMICYYTSYYNMLSFHFRGLNTMYQSITNLVGSWPCSVQIAIDFFTSAAFVVPLIAFLL